MTYVPVLGAEQCSALETVTMGEEKNHGKSLSVRVRKNSGNFISNGPILLVWVKHPENLSWKD